MSFGIDFSKLANSIGNAVQEISTYSAKATARSNAISAQAQSAQGAFNQESANTANLVDNGRLASQYGFNSAMMQSANEYNTEAWEKAAAWNEMMWQKQADFNAEQAQIQRDWQERMSNTQYQRAMTDMENAGLNPILAYSNGGAGIPGGAAASVGGAQMSSAQSQMASGGLLGANAASEGNYTGIAENMGTTLALLGAMFAGISSAYQASNGLGDYAGTVVDEITDELNPKNFGKQLKEAFQQGKKNQNREDYIPNYRNGIDWNMKDYKGSYWKNDGSNEFRFRAGHAKG